MRKGIANYYDYIIVGSGIAGLYTALLAKDSGTVLILTKGSIDETNTKHAQGGIAAPIGKQDSPELHYQDTMNAGAGLCNPEAVRILVSEATDRIADLIKFGVPFDTVNGEIALTKEAAHSVPRILHAGGDATGEHIEVTLSRRIRDAGVMVLEHCLAMRIVMGEDGSRGVVALDTGTGSIDEYSCRSLILATGGMGRLFKYTTNSDVATGDGVALAYEAGAEITDMEFLQFHPTALRLPGVAPFLISEAVRGEGGILRNVDNQAFMHDYSPEADLSPRDVVARSIVNEMKKTNSERVFLDVTHLPESVITTRFPNIYRFCLDHGLDISRGLIPVAPAAHYMMGGIKVNTWGETNIPSLFAVGETACTGVHGANRLASNSLLEVIVFSKRIIERSLQTRETESQVAQCRETCSLSESAPLSGAPLLNLPMLQALMWDKVGIVRNGPSLVEARRLLAAWHARLSEPIDRPSYELKNMITGGRLMAEAASLREESRGAHYRTDCPQPSESWRRNLVFRKKQ